MFTYWIDGFGYNQIMISTYLCDNLYVQQLFVDHGVIVRRSVVKFLLSPDKTTLVAIETNETDTVILPKGVFVKVAPYAVEGCDFERLIVPLDMNLKFMDKALYGSDALCDYMSLSKNVTYGQNVFPDTVRRTL